LQGSGAIQKKEKAGGWSLAAARINIATRGHRGESKKKKKGKGMEMGRATVVSSLAFIEGKKKEKKKRGRVV